MYHKLFIHLPIEGCLLACKCNNNNIKPIIGLNVILKDFNICLYVKDYIGYQNIMKLSTIQNENIVEIKDLEKFNDGLICIIPYQYRDCYSLITNIYKDIYLGYSNKKEAMELKEISNNIVFFRENLYVNIGDSEYLPYLYSIRDGKTISDEVSYDTLNHELYIKDIYSFSEQEGIINTIKISDLCNLSFPPVENLLPIYDCSDPDKYLFELCKAGINKRLGGVILDSYKNRLSYELKIISEMGFSNYFLVVYDFIKYVFLIFYHFKVIFFCFHCFVNFIFLFK